MARLRRVNRDERASTEETLSARRFFALPRLYERN
jgi:hypothetical protein